MNWAIPMAPAGLTALGSKSAFLPQQPRQEIRVQPVLRGVAFDQLADIRDIVIQPDTIAPVIGAALIRAFRNRRIADHRIDRRARRCALREDQNNGTEESKATHRTHLARVPTD